MAVMVSKVGNATDKRIRLAQLCRGYTRQHTATLAAINSCGYRCKVPDLDCGLGRLARSILP